MVCVRVLIVLISWLCCVMSAHAQQLSRLQSVDLNAAYLVQDPDQKIISATLVILSGEMDNPYAQGLAHYLEHLAWLNTLDKVSPDYDRETNAWTNIYTTGYWLAGPIEKLPVNLMQLFKVFDPLDSDPVFLAQERKIILREYDVRMGENIWKDTDKDLRLALFGDQPVARSVIGIPQEIAIFSLQDARALHKGTHRPMNAVLLIYGDISKIKAQAILDKVKIIPAATANPAPRFFEFGPDLRDLQRVDLPQTSEQTLIYKKITHLPKPVPFDRLRAQLTLLYRVLDSTYESGLGGPLRFDNFIARHFSIGLGVLDKQNIVLDFEANPDDGITLQTLLDSFETNMAQIAKNGISAQTFETVKSLYIANLRDQPRPAPGVKALAMESIASRQIPQTREQRLQSLRDVSLADLDALLKHLTGNGRTVIRLVN